MPAPFLRRLKAAWLCLTRAHFCAYGWNADGKGTYWQHCQYLHLANVRDSCQEQLDDRLRPDELLEEANHLINPDR